MKEPKKPRLALVSDIVGSLAIIPFITIVGSFYAAILVATMPIRPILWLAEKMGEWAGVPELEEDWEDC